MIWNPAPPQGFGLWTARVGPLAATAPQNPAPPGLGLRRPLSVSDCAGSPLWTSGRVGPHIRVVPLVVPSVPVLELCVLICCSLASGNVGVLRRPLAMVIAGNLSRAQKCQSACRPHGHQGPPVTWEQLRGSAACREGRAGAPGLLLGRGRRAGFGERRLVASGGSSLSLSCVPQAVSAACRW